MLLLLPPSETKTAPEAGRPFEPQALSFPELTGTRAAVLDALLEVSAAPDAGRRLGVRDTLLHEVRRNLELRGAPTAAAGTVYSGAMYDGLGLGHLDGAARRRARSWVVIVSALFGAVRPTDRIPAYRLHMCGRLPGLAHLPDVWREPLDGVLPGAAGRGLIVDFRSAEYATVWRPTGPLAARTVVVRVTRRGGGRRGTGAHRARYTRGQVARQILVAGVDHREPQELADALGPAFDVQLYPGRLTGTCELDVVES